MNDVTHMFSPDDRQRLRDTLIASARADERIASAALTGSGALGSEDRWSDIDLAFGVADETSFSELVAEWTDVMYRHHHAAHHVDVNWGNVLFRVFLLANTLQVDLSFWPASEFGAIAPTFRLLFGNSKEQPMQAAPSAESLIGMGWLYALHARSSIARGRVWQAEYMISGIRDQVLALACLRHGISAVQARGTDNLPLETTAPVVASLVRSLDVDELHRAFVAVIDALVIEIERTDAELARRLTVALREIASLRSKTEQCETGGLTGR
jgi:hypothetical protein